jgi:prepilin-type N-terminal cleavage/methylation domain-containing protein
MNDELNPDTGFTLIELIVAAMLSVLVLTIAGSMLVSAMNTSNTVQSVTGASSSGLLVANSVERGIRNSTDFLLTTPSGNDQLLVARVAQGDTTLTWKCAAWYYSATNGTVRYTLSGSAIPAAPTAAQLAGWTQLDSGIAPVSGTTIFTATDEQLSVDFNVTASGHPPVEISSSATSRAGSSGDLTCY